MIQPRISIQPVEKRIKNFSEVSLGFSKKQATEEALRCPQPSNPEHIHRCPLGIDVHGFIRLIRENDVNGALQKIKEHNHLPGICGRLCSAPCEQNFFPEENWSVSIKALERYASDFGSHKSLKQKEINPRLQKIAVIGSGPAGLTAAGDLAKLGYGVTIFEAFYLPGGVLRYDSPEFRLPKKVLDGEIEYIKSLGVEIKTSHVIGTSLTLEELLKEGYAAVFLALGAGLPKFSNISGEHFGRVYLANEFLMRVKFKQERGLLQDEFFSSMGKKIAIVGSEAAAIDCARTAIRLGKEVVLVFEGTEDDLKAAPEEINFAKDEGVKFEVLTRTLEIFSDENYLAKGLRCVKMDFADPNSSGSWKLIPVQGSDFNLEADTVILSSGCRPNSSIGKFIKDLKINKDGSIWTKKNSSATSIPGVFAGGSVVSGAGDMIDAMVSAKAAVQEIANYVKGKSV